jgi:hypothetical protein
MNKKLTLSLDESIIDKAKKYADTHKESVSQLVENYFRVITSDTESPKQRIAPLVKELTGSIKVPADFDYEQTKYEYLKEKHLHD